MSKAPLLLLFSAHNSLHWGFIDYESHAPICALTINGTKFQNEQDTSKPVMRHNRTGMYWCVFGQHVIIFSKQKKFFIG